ncbi:MAG: hypothetical protein DYG98_19950 [Haliscomenobacteraceae bacterium CHB4]|nr:hypothetical protein [Saprospiraceae bacterium]MCE7925333.1 hypothetical protein [Haliscomenobacteraceae bacterium CHB4]
MRHYRIWIAAILACVVWSGVFAHVPDNYRRPANTNKVKYRDVCANSESQIDQEINNVRARLLGGGDCWWDFNDGRYIVPKVDVSSGQREVSSIFAASVWLGGVDPAKNLKLACQDYRAGGANDFWPGPLNEAGLTESFTCDNWDRHFRVTGEEIRRHLANLAAGNLSDADIPKGVKGWPARGNPYFADVWGFDLPYTQQALAGFYDVNGDGDYKPLEGDYPSIEIRGCALDRYPDEMIFWIYNDQGGGAEHARTKGTPIQMEVQVQSFSYVTNDELNDMTFQRYKLINRAVDRIDSTFFAMWVDPDLGCYTDDYIGCDTATNLMYVYNQDPVDGTTGCTCDQGVASYCDKVPILGVDYFRGPVYPDSVQFDRIDPVTGDSLFEPVEIGMSSFVYYNNPGVGTWPAATTDPDLPLEFYRYLTGHWKDGSPFQYGGSGYQSGGANINYAFTDAPNSGGWSMCEVNLPFGDRRTLQASGPFTLQPGAVNELIIGVPWVPDITYPCPDLEQLLRADKLAQGLFDNCFDILDGPNAPNVDWIELNQEVVAVLTNVAPSNNVNEAYREQDFLAPDSLKKHTPPAAPPTPEELESTYYKFEGYKIYQLTNPNVSNAEFESDPDKSRLVYQVDIRNGITSIYNWEETFNPSDKDKPVYVPVLQVQGEDKGIRHTFSIKDDKFATGNDKRLINHKKYYFAVIAYAYNNFDTFDPLSAPPPGQQRSYLPGRQNGDGTQISIITVIPRPVIDQALQSSYGDGVVVTRLEGAGNGGNFLDLDSTTRANLWTGALADTALTYKTGRGPLNITIFNPFEVKDGDYELRMVDGNMTDTKLDDTTRWELRRLPDGAVIVSDRTISEINEQIVKEYGFSVNITQQAESGSLNQDESNGAIGGEIEYSNRNQQWLAGFADQENGIFNFVKTQKLEIDEEFDPSQELSTLGDGFFVPYTLCDWRLTPLTDFEPMFTPAWTEMNGSIALNGTANGNPAQRREKLAKLPNVDIVLTSDKSKWSRCVVIETASWYYTNGTYAAIQDPTLQTESPANKERVTFDVRYAPSVGKDDNNNDGLPDPDGAVAPAGAPDAGQPIRGMGWFPGYAIDVETGQRLNIFFGENSCYSSALDPTFTGRDMLWNPTDQVVRETSNNFTSFFDLILGGQHFVYVMNTPYDECETLRRRFTPELNNFLGSAKVQQVRNIAWAGMLQMANGTQLKTLREGLIPNDVTIKLRVDNPYQTWYQDDNAGKKTGHPRYQFKIQGRQSQPLTEIQIANALDSIKVVPNPYYGFSQYETSQFTNTIKITNLPGKCTVTIYSLDGKFIRQYQRNEVYAPYQQITDALEWDLKNNKGIPVASGVYLIHVANPELGERTIKWFGIARQFDPSGL